MLAMYFVIRLMVEERLFARSVYGLPSLGRKPRSPGAKPLVADGPCVTDCGGFSRKAFD